MKRIFAGEKVLKRAPLGTYWRIKPLVFSFRERCRGFPGSAKKTSMPMSLYAANSVPLSSVSVRADRLVRVSRMYCATISDFLGKVGAIRV